MYLTRFLTEVQSTQFVAELNFFPKHWIELSQNQQRDNVNQNLDKGH